MGNHHQQRKEAYRPCRTMILKGAFSLWLRAPFACSLFALFFILCNYRFGILKNVLIFRKKICLNSCFLLTFYKNVCYNMESQEGFRKTLLTKKTEVQFYEKTFYYQAALPRGLDCGFIRCAYLCFWAVALYRIYANPSCLKRLNRVSRLTLAQKWAYPLYPLYPVKTG